MKKLKRWLVFRPYERHSLVLMVGGLTYILIGITFLIADPLSTAREQALTVALQWFTMTFWSYAFIFAGLLALLSSRWPTFSDTWGYAVLTGISAGWSTMYILGMVFGPSRHINISFAAVWGLLAFLWWAISGLVNPPRRRLDEPN